MTAQSNLVVGLSKYMDGVATIAGSKYRCFSIRQFHTLNEFSISEIVVIPETAGLGLPDTTAKIYDSLLAVKKGAAVTVSYTISEPATPALSQKEVTNATTKVFTGVFLGLGPIWLRPSSLKITIWVIHPLGQLDWATTSLDAIHGFGFDDYRLPMVPGKSEEIVPYMMGGYKASDVETDLWKLVIKPELIALCTTNRFGTPNAKAAADYLTNAANDASLQPLSLKVGDPSKVILDVRRTLMSSAMGRRSLWDNLAALANTYKFNIVCRANDFMVVPALPALGGTITKAKEHFPLRCFQFSTREEFNALARRITQSIGMSRGPGGLPNFFDVESRKRREATGVLAGDTVVAGTDFTAIPRFLDFGMEPFFKTRLTLGLSTEKLSAAGYKIVSEPLQDPTSLNKQYNAGTADTDLKNYAAVVMNEQAYSGTTAVFKGGINWNVCPGNSVQVEPPGYYASPDAVLAACFYGRVWSVATIIEQGSSHTGTYLVLTHVRTDKEQAAIVLSRHPMYDKRWVSAPLLNIPSFTEGPVYA